MKVEENSDMRLVLRRRPWLMGLFLYGMSAWMLVAAVLGIGPDGFDGRPAEPMERVGMLLAVLVGLGCAWCFAAAETVVFDRRAGLIAWRRRRLFWVSEAAEPLSGIARVDVEESRDDESGGFRSVLVWPDRRVPLTQYYSGFFSEERETDVIRDWLTRAA